MQASRNLNLKICINGFINVIGVPDEHYIIPLAHRNNLYNVLSRI